MDREYILEAHESFIDSVSEHLKITRDQAIEFIHTASDGGYECYDHLTRWIHVKSRTLFSIETVYQFFKP